MTLLTLTVSREGFLGARKPVYTSYRRVNASETFHQGARKNPIPLRSLPTAPSPRVIVRSSRAPRLAHQAIGDKPQSASACAPPGERGPPSSSLAILVRVRRKAANSPRSAPEGAGEIYGEFCPIHPRRIVLHPLVSPFGHGRMQSGSVTESPDNNNEKGGC